MQDKVVSRPYLCKCGKSYLSYPALYTHIRHKKGDRRSHVFVRPDQSQTTKRGRPPARPEPVQDLSPDDILQDINNQARNEVELLLIDLIKLIRNEGNPIVLEGNEYPQPSRLLDCFKELSECFKTDYALFQAFEKIALLSEEKLYQDDIRIMNQEEIILLPIHDVLARYLHALGQQLRPFFFKEVVILILLFADTLNKLPGLDCTIINSSATDNCSRYASNSIIEYLNDLVESVPELMVRRPELKEIQVLKEEEMLKSICLRFGGWMKARRYTSDVIELK